MAMARLWRRMAALYGARWTAGYGDAIDGDGRLTDTAQCWADALADLPPEALARGLRRCVHDRPDPWPPSLPEFRHRCQPTPADLGLPSVEDAYRIATRQHPDWAGVHPLVWHARRAVGYFELVNEPASRTRPRFESAYADLVRRALQGETFAFPEGLSLPALPPPSPPPLTDGERADIQRWALDLSRIDDSTERERALRTAPVPWQPVIRHYLAWRLSRAAWPAQRRTEATPAATPPAPMARRPRPPRLSPEEEDRLLADARARYQARPEDGAPVWSPPVEAEDSA